MILPAAQPAISPTSTHQIKFEIIWDLLCGPKESMVGATVCQAGPLAGPLAGRGPVFKSSYVRPQDPRGIWVRRPPTSLPAEVARQFLPTPLPQSQPFYTKKF